jgi:hypothetical protein
VRKLPRALEEAWDRVGKELCARHFREDWALGLFWLLAVRFLLLLFVAGASKDCAFGAFRVHARQEGTNDDEMRIFVFMHWSGFGDVVVGKRGDVGRCLRLVLRFWIPFVCCGV